MVQALRKAGGKSWLKEISITVRSVTDQTANKKTPLPVAHTMR
jgi:hypothetical protein